MLGQNIAGHTVVRAALGGTVLGAVCIVGAWGLWQERENVRLARQFHAAALVSDSSAAAADSTRAVQLQVAGETITVWQRRALQAAQRADSLDRALGLERAARYQIIASVTPLTASVTGAVTPSAAAPVLSTAGSVHASDAVRTGAFVIHQAPYHLVASVTLPPPPGRGAMTVGVTLDSARIALRVGCSAADASGVRPASVTLSGPAWLSLQLGELTQEPRVCSPERSRGAARPSARGRWFPRVAFGVGLAAGWALRR